MEYAIKRIEPEPSKGYNYPQDPVKYEFSVPEATKDVNGTDVFIPKVLYVHSLEELTAQKTALETSLAGVMEKIEKINALNAGVKVELSEIVTKTIER